MKDIAFFAVGFVAGAGLTFVYAKYIIGFAANVKQAAKDLTKGA